VKSEPEQEIYLGNFKKLLTGSLNTRLFELSFDDNAPKTGGRTCADGSMLLGRRILSTAAMNI
jgi:hypothetical protein